MKLATPELPITDHTISSRCYTRADTLSQRTPALPVTSRVAGAFHRVDAPIQFRPQAKSRAVSMVVVLAFCQSLLFLAFWLFLCASAGAATSGSTEFDPQLQLSSYNPSKTRDPFLKVGAAGAGSKSVSVGSAVFRLQGILYHPVDPSAIINDQLVSLNKTVTLSSGDGEIQVKAVEITRERVVLDAGGNKVELRLSSQESKAE